MNLSRPLAATKIEDNDFDWKKREREREDFEPPRTPRAPREEGKKKRKDSNSN